MYSSSVRSTMKIDGKGSNGNIMIDVGGYRGEDVSDYVEQELELREPVEFYYGNWRIPLWKKMFADMNSRMKRWKYRLV